MKLATLIAVATVSTTVAAQYIDAEITATPTSDLVLEKRYKDVIMGKDYKKMQALKDGSATAEPTLRPWARTIYSTKVEIVTPTVIAGVTFGAKPPKTTNGLEPWVSLDKLGSPKTIKPKMKNGIIEKKSPDYSTYFQTATTVLYNKEQLKAHNMADDEIYEHVEYIPEDLTYQSLVPILRCTPELYKMKGLGKDKTPEPFCTPHDDSRLVMDKTYFVTWYTRFFSEEVKLVKLHLSYIKESLRQKGLKRDLGIEKDEVTIIDKRSKVIETGGKLGQKSFFVSEPIDRDTGYFPLSIEPEWFGEKDYYRKVLISLQPDTVPDDEFDHMGNYIIVEFAKGAKVAKGHQEDLKKLDEKLAQKLTGDVEIEEGLNYEKYITIISIPTCVLLAVFGMWLFVLYNKKNTDLSFLKQVKLNRRKTKLPYAKSKATELPRWEGPKAD